MYKENNDIVAYTLPEKPVNITILRPAPSF
jgi:hypothetical protein